MATGLGRGLGSLIPQKTINKQVMIPDGNHDLMTIDPKDKILRINPNEIQINPFQPRKRFSDYKLDELVESIKNYGVLQPLLVTEKNGKYELVAGERRLRASKKANLAEVPVIVKKANDEEKLEIALIENIQREELNPVETAEAYKKLMDEFHLTQEEMAKKVGKPRSSVANTLRMLSLPEEIRLALMDGRITEGHAKYLVGLDTEVKQMALYRRIVHNNLSVQDTGNEIKIIGTKQPKMKKINYADKDKEFAFREFFGARVEVKRKGKGGQVIIQFSDDEELNGMIAKMKS